MESAEARLPEEMLTVLDPNLSLLASQAAIELDSLVRNEPTELEATKHIAMLLNRAFEKTEEPPVYKLLIDPTTMALMGRALSMSQSESKIQTVRDLAEEAWRISTTLQNPAVTEDRKNLESIRAFFAALSEGAASYLRSFYSSRSTHPYKR